MRKFKVFVLLFLTFVTFTEQHNAFCCTKQQSFLDDENDTCINEFTNTVSNINIACDKRGRLIGYNYTVTENGHLLIYIDEQSEAQLEPGKFCVQNETNASNSSVIVYCDTEEEEILDEKVLGYCMFVSSFFLMLTALVYVILPEMRDLEGKCIINFCVSLGLGKCILGIMKVMEYSDMNWCATRGFLAYFFIVATFFWSNVISIHILRSIRRLTVRDFSWRQFLYYALYAWGCPVLLTIAMAIVNFHPGRHQKPGIGLNHCWFFDTTQQWYYMYSVMTILIFINISIFTYISVHLWRQSFSSSYVKAVKYRFMMTVRLVVVMGLPWVFEIISALSPPHIIWTILDIINALQGPIIFVLIVLLRRRVLKALLRHGWLFCTSDMMEKYLAIGDDEEDIVQHTDVPLHDRLTN